MIVYSEDIVYGETNDAMVSFREEVKGFDLRLIDVIDGEIDFSLVLTIKLIYTKALVE